MKTKMDLPTLLQELGNTLTDRENPDADIALITLIEEIRKILPREPNKASDLLRDTLMALSLEAEGTEKAMNLTLVQSMVPEILAGIQPLPVRPPSVQIGLLMLGEAISREESDVKTFYDILVKPFIEEGALLSTELDNLMVFAAENPMAKCHAEMAGEWLISNNLLDQASTKPAEPMDLSSDSVSNETEFLRYLLTLSTSTDSVEKNELLETMFNIHKGPLSRVWYSDQLGKIIDEHIEDQAIFNCVLEANEYLEKKMLSETKE